MATLHTRASMSTPYPDNGPIVLPGINELFPEHIPRSLHATLSGRAFPPQSFVHVLRPYPALKQLALPCFAPAYSLSTFALKPAGSDSAYSHSSSGSSNDNADDADDAGEGGGGGREAKKYICPTCRKRFNRPSSLRIHANTHTGATPFKCPHPGCGRAFNVKSNMHRHYRSHVQDAERQERGVSLTSPVASPPFTTPIFDSSPLPAASATYWGPATQSASPTFSTISAPVASPPLSPISVSSWSRGAITGYFESNVRSGSGSGRR